MKGPQPPLYPLPHAAASEEEADEFEGPCASVDRVARISICKPLARPELQTLNGERHDTLTHCNVGDRCLARFRWGRSTHSRANANKGADRHRRRRPDVPLQEHH